MSDIFLSEKPSGFLMGFDLTLIMHQSGATLFKCRKISLINVSSLEISKIKKKFTTTKIIRVH